MNKWYSRAENQKLLADVQEASTAKNQKLQEIHESVSKRITGVEESVSDLERTVDTKVNDLERTVDTKVNDLEKTVDTKMNVLESTAHRKLVMMEEKINNLHSQRPEPVRVVSERNARIKLPCFDGSSPLSVFKFQFETVASRNGWDDDEKALEAGATIMT